MSNSCSSSGINAAQKALVLSLLMGSVIEATLASSEWQELLLLAGPLQIINRAIVTGKKVTLELRKGMAEGEEGDSAWVEILGNISFLNRDISSP